jgi:hypothetical protein
MGWMKGSGRTAVRALLVVLVAATMAAAKGTTTPVPGTLNYVEGQVMLDGRNISAKSAGSEVLGVNQLLDTGRGKAELLLTPGVFLRVGDNSELRMISPGLADTSVGLVKGSAIVEAAELFKENDLSVVVDGSTTRIEKNGLYDFSADQAAVSVLDGKATVYEGDAHVTLKRGHEALLASAQPFHSQKVDKNAVEADPLYRWSKLRSQYEAEANLDTAQTIVANGGWYGPGWYWDPFWGFYSFMPADGFLYSPFGWAFYSPWAFPGGYYGYHGYYHYPVRGPGYRAPFVGHNFYGGHGFGGPRGFGGGHFGHR